MSFTLGNFNTDSMAGLTASLVSWPMAPVSPSFDDLPAGDGALFYQSNLTKTTWTFNLQLDAASYGEVMNKADQLSAIFHPLKGLQAFSPEGATAWVWQAIASTGIQWQRDKVLWFPNGFCRLEGQVVLTTPDPYGYAAQDEVFTLASAGTLAINRQKGNIASWARLEFKGVLTASQSLNVAQTAVSGPLGATQVMVLDYNTLDFGVWDAGMTTKLANIVQRMSSYDRIGLPVGASTLTASVTGGTFTQLTVRANSRRV